MPVVKDAIDLFRASGGLVEGHFVLSSGAHSGSYANKTVALAPASHGKHYAAVIASAFGAHDIETVVGPELGAVIMVADVRTALHTESWNDVLGVVAEKVPGQKGAFTIGRQQAVLVTGKRVLVVEDVITSGDSAHGTIKAVRDIGGIVVGLAVLWNRSHVTAALLGVEKLFSVIEHEIVTYPEDDCPLCKAGVPVNTDLGKGAEFLARKSSTS